MSSNSLEDIKKKVKDYVDENPTQSILIGAGAALLIGFIAYKLFSRDRKTVATIKKQGRPEDVVVELETPGSYESVIKEETKTRVAPVEDSEDEPVLLRQSIKPKRDTAGVLDKETLIKIFDKRSTIRGMRRLEKTFKEKRRAAFYDPPEYK